MRKIFLIIFACTLLVLGIISLLATLLFTGTFIEAMRHSSQVDAGAGFLIIFPLIFLFFTIGILTSSWQTWKKAQQPEPVFENQQTKTNASSRKILYFIGIVCALFIMFYSVYYTWNAFSIIFLNK